MVLNLVISDKVSTFALHKTALHMSKKEKLIQRFLTHPMDFTFEEMVALFGIFGFTLQNKGKSSGSRVLFQRGTDKYIMHKPHPGNIVVPGAMKSAADYIASTRLIEEFRNKTK